MIFERLWLDVHDGLRIRPPGLDEWIAYCAFLHSEAAREVDEPAVNWRCKASAADSRRRLEIVAAWRRR
jgi:hypothetical protein